MNSRFTGDFKPFTKLDEFLLIYLKSYFEHHPDFSWSEKNTKIAIQTAFSIESEDSHFLPKIVLQSGPYSLTNFNLLSNDLGNKLLKDFTQTREVAYRVGCIYVLNILAQNPKQARGLSEEISVMFAMYANEIREKFNISIEKVFNLRPEMPKFEGREFKSNTVQLELICSYVYFLSSRVLPIYPKLAEVDLTNEVEKKLEVNKLKFVKEPEQKVS